MIKIQNKFIITKEKFSYHDIIEYFAFDEQEVKNSLYNKFNIILNKFINYIIINLFGIKIKIKNKFIIEKIIKKLTEEDLFYLINEINNDIENQKNSEFTKKDKIDFEKFFISGYETNNSKVIKLYYEFLFLSNTNLSLKEIRNLNYSDFKNFIKIIKIKNGNK